MPEKKRNNIEPYRLARPFELAILHHLMFSRNFWTRVGLAVESDAFSDGTSKLVAAAAFAIGQETGSAAGDGSIVLQRLARWMDHGRVNNEQVLDCEELIAELEYMDAPGEEDITTEFLPIVKVRRNKAALHLGMKLLANRQDFRAVIDHMNLTDRLGELTRLSGIDISATAPRNIKRATHTSRLATGMGELDGALNGGPLPKTLNVVMGDSNVGKSMFLVHVVGYALAHGINTLVATLELNDEQWSDRLFANLSGVPIDSITDGTGTEDCVAQLERIDLARCRVESFTAKATKVPDLLEWAQEIEKQQGWKAKLLVVDYADLLGHSKSRDYEGMGDVYGGLREGWAVKRNGWVWTATQARRRGKSSEKAGLNDAADSQNKVRVSDTMIALNATDDDYIEYGVVKYRSGKSGGTCSMPTAFEYGRMCPINPYGGGNGDDRLLF